MNKIMAILPNTNFEQAKLTCSKLLREAKIIEILEAQPNRGLCLSVNVGIVETRKGSKLEKVIQTAESHQIGLRDFCLE